MTFPTAWGPAKIVYNVMQQFFKADIHVQSFEDDDVTISWKIEKDEIDITERLTDV